ncbi:MAG: hypothetical protein KDB24_17775, partial [Microthrixaceae bacterium]|nr:hypothetical protein [Microthrixaceae bacterium]
MRHSMIRRRSLPAAVLLLLQPLVVLLASAPADAAEPVIVSLTFDDALTEHALAGDLLAERGLQGTFYVPTG